MKRATFFSVILLVAMLCPVCSNAEIYRWVDEEGVVHFSDDINAVPLKYRPERVSDKPDAKKKQFNLGQENWGSMTDPEKAEYLRRLREKKEAEEDREMARYPEHVKTLIRGHKLEVGMTKGMVLLSWGSPTHVSPPGTGTQNVQEKWTYVTVDPVRRVSMYFENDILTRWEE